MLNLIVLILALVLTGVGAFGVTVPRVDLFRLGVFFLVLWFLLTGV